jgi:hypothetical protein
MLSDFLRLALGVTLALLHRPIADFILSQEYALAGLFRQRGIQVPAPPTTETIRNLYFLLGIALALISLGRIWFGLHPGTLIF